MSRVEITSEEAYMICEDRVSEYGYAVVQIARSSIKGWVEVKDWEMAIFNKFGESMCGQFKFVEAANE